MNSNTGEVVNFNELTDEKRAEIENSRDWVKFNLGEEIVVKGIKFFVKEVGQQRLVLQFKR